MLLLALFKHARLLFVHLALRVHVLVLLLLLLLLRGLFGGRDACLERGALGAVLGVECAALRGERLVVLATQRRRLVGQRALVIGGGGRRRGDQLRANLNG